MTTCKQCGTELLENQSACPGCGAEVTIDSTTDEQIETAAPPSDGGELTTGAETPADVETESGAPAAGSFETKPLGTPAPAKARAASAAPSGGMSSTAKALIAAGVAVAIALGLIFWQFQSRRSRGVKLSAEDVAEIVKTMAPPQQLAALAGNEKQRKDIAKELRELLAVAQEARAAGLADKPETQRQIDTLRTFVLAQAYAQKQRDAGATTPDKLYSKDEIDNFLKEQGQEQKFEQFLKDVQELGLVPATGGVSDEQKAQLKNDLWAPTQVLARKAQAGGLDKERKTQLLIQLQEAQVLAQKYAPQLQERTKVTDQEIDAKVAEVKNKAGDVLKRVRSGEDFGELAKQFGGDGTKDKGGDLGWFKRGAMVKEFDEVAFALQPGQVSDVVETQFGYHIIKVDERRMGKDEAGKDAEEVHARHILIKPDAGEGANPFAAPPALRDQVKQSLEKEKRDKIVEEIVRRTKVEVADDFKVEVPPQTPMPQLPPQGAMPGAGGGEEMLPVEPAPAPSPAAKNSNGKK